MTTIMWFIVTLLLVGCSLCLGAYIYAKYTEKNNLTLDDVQKALKETVKEGKTVLVYNIEDFIKNVSNKLKK